MSKLLITGSGGFVGKNLYKKLQGEFDLVGLDCTKSKTVDQVLDISDRDGLIKVLETYRPDIIIHLAALSNVDRCEKEKELTYENNVVSTETLVNWSKLNNTKMIYMSSDYVYDGFKGNFTEQDQENPIQYYGESKLMSEKLVSSLGNYIILRPTVIYGWDPEGMNFFMQLYRKQKKQKKILVPNDQISNPTFVDDLCNLIKKIIKGKWENGIYNSTGPESYGRYELAKEFCEFMGWDQSLIIPVETIELHQVAKRPLNNSTISKKINDVFNFEFSNLLVSLEKIKTKMQTHKPLSLTVAIPSYNKEKYIERCIKSVLLEKGYIDKILVVDNNSTDRTWELAKKFEPEVECVQNGTNLGMSGNWNRCIDLCKTDLLMIFHADDELLPDTIKKYLDFFKNHPSVGLVHADIYNLNEGPGEVKLLAKTDHKQIRKAGLEALEVPGCVCSSVMVRKSVYDDLGYFLEESMASDVDMWKRIASKYDIGHLDAPTVVYYIIRDSTGFDSLKNRSIKEIEADWELLGKHIRSYYPEELRKELKRKDKKGFVDGFVKVAVVNFRNKQYKKTFQALYMVFFKYRGFLQVIQRFFQYLLFKYRKYKIKINNIFYV
ncbi:MAG: sugar nucleotide-binding protein [bacterium]